MSKVKAQQEEERFYLDQFLDTMEIKPDSVETGEDPPDLYFVHGNRRIAVELTNFHSDETGPGGHSRREVEEEWLKIQELFREKRKKFSELNEISGFLSFIELNVPPKTKHEQFVNELLNFACEKLTEITSEGTTFNKFPEKFPLLDKYLMKICMHQANCYVPWEWNHAAGSGGVRENELMKIILSKIKAPPSDNIAENWLLIISGHQISQFMGIPHIGIFNDFREVNELLHNGPFDKVYIFQYMLSRVLLWQSSLGWSEEKKAEFSRPSKNPIMRLMNKVKYYYQWYKFRFLSRFDKSDYDTEE